MKHASRFILLPLCAVALGACGSTNHLEDYTLARQTFLFQTSVASDVSMVRMHVSNPATARTVWQECGNRHVPLRRTPGGVVPIAGTATSIYNAIEFFRLSETEIQDAMLAAAAEAGRALGEELREDYAASR